MNTDRRSYDTGASQQAQSEIEATAARLESVINERTQQVQTAMADFQADGVSEQYAFAEQRWNSAADQVREIIRLVRTTLARNDETATTANSKARAHAQGII